MYEVDTGVTVALCAALAMFQPGCTAATDGYCATDQDCLADQRCDTMRHACIDRAQQGSSCQQDLQCAGGNCVDGVCCESRCPGTCRSCATASARGRCVLVAEGDDPRGDCAGDAPACAGSCDGAGSCRFPDSATACQADSCSAGELTRSHCNGSGACSSQTQSCGGYACDAAGEACRSQCQSPDQCTGSAQCVGQACVDQQPLGATCGENDLACTSGHCVDGICCDSACDGGPCVSCTTGSAGGGTCSPVADGTPCNGGAITCVDSASSSGLWQEQCQAGSCQPVETQRCDPYRCAAGACATGCADHDGCTTGLCDLFNTFGTRYSCPPAGEICYVDANSPCATASCTGSRKHPHHALQSCVDQSSTRYVVIAPGKGTDYSGTLTIDRPLQLVATGTTGQLVQGRQIVPGTLSATLRSDGIIVQAAGQVVIHGLAIRAESGPPGSLLQVNGLATQLQLSSVRISDCASMDPALITVGPTLMQDSAIQSCAGGVQSSAQLTLDRVVLENLSYGAIIQLSGPLKLSEVTVADTLEGVGLHASNSAVNIDRLQITGTTASLSQGQGVVLHNCTGAVRNTLVAQNAAGGIELHGDVVPDLINCTLAHNGGYELDYTDCNSCATLTVTNSIVWDPSTHYAKDAFNGTAQIQFRYSDVLTAAASGVVAGAGNLRQDPQFAAPTSGAFQLGSSSPCLDAGLDTVAGSHSKDLAGEPRLVDLLGGAAEIDMGAYELQWTNYNP